MFFQFMCAEEEEEEEAVSYRKCACKRKRHKISEDLVFILIFFFFFYFFFIYSFFFFFMLFSSCLHSGKQLENIKCQQQSSFFLLFYFHILSVPPSSISFSFSYTYYIMYTIQTSLLFGCTLKCQESILPNTNNHKYKLYAPVIHQMMFNSIHIWYHSSS